MNLRNKILYGDCLAILADLPAGVFQTCITSPPYWKKRKYGVLPTRWPGDPGLEIKPWRGRLGWEETPGLYVAHLVQVFREVWRVLRDDATAWINIGDSYGPGGGVRGKDMALIPARLSLALQADGWWVRNDGIWHKPNAMPESPKDRLTRDHEYFFFLSKSRRYYFDQVAIKEPYTAPLGRWGGDTKKMTDNLAEGSPYKGAHRERPMRPDENGRNKRTVWKIPTRSYKGAHFATFPPKLVEPMVLASSSDKACQVCGMCWTRVIEKTEAPHDGKTKSAYEKRSAGNRLALLRQAARERGEEYRNVTKTLRWEPTCECPGNDGSAASIVLDPFVGSGTTCAVAKAHGRDYLGIEANAEYVKLAERRVREEGIRKNGE